MSFRKRFDTRCSLALAVGVAGAIAFSAPTAAWAQDAEPVFPETPAAPAAATPATATAPPPAPGPAASSTATAGGIAAEKAPLSSGDEMRARHGWYLSARLGGGALAGSNINKDGDSRSAGLSGGTVNLNMAVGRSLGQGLALGAELYVMGAPGPSASFPSGASLSTGTLNLIGIGPFVDYYFDRSKGWHLQAAAGYGLIMGPSSCTDSGSCTHSDDLFEDMSGSALSVSAGIGHDWWIGPAFSLGVLASGGYTTGSMSNPANFKLDVQAPVFALQVTGTMWK